MAAVRARDTTPELTVRRMVHSLGFRYGLYKSTLPGKPDLVFLRRRKVIFVHGCFWHMHSCPHGKKGPATNKAYWDRKRRRNRVRDQEHTKALRKTGWKVLILWECRLKNEQILRKTLLRFLS